MVKLLRLLAFLGLLVSVAMHVDAWLGIAPPRALRWGVGLLLFVLLLPAWMGARWELVSRRTWVWLSALFVYQVVLFGVSWMHRFTDLRLQTGQFVLAFAVAGVALAVRGGSGSRGAG